MSIEAIRDDLAKIIDQAMWAHGYGYSKAGRGLDAERGVDLSRTEREREEGPTYDLEIGDHRARVAYQAAVRNVSRADRLTAAMLYEDGVRYQLPVEPLDLYVAPFYLRRCAHRLSWRLERLDADLHRKRVEAIRKAFDRTIRGLSKAMDHGTAVSALKENPCRTCGIRERRPKGTECKTCETWRMRHDGQPRPVKLDADSINQARAAQARRMARGEGWGVA